MNFGLLMDCWDKIGQMILAYKLCLMDCKNVNSDPLIDY
jgi:hypothetical protein